MSYKFVNGIIKTIKIIKLAALESEHKQLGWDWEDEGIRHSCLHWWSCVVNPLQRLQAKNHNIKSTCQNDDFKKEDREVDHWFSIFFYRRMHFLVFVVPYASENWQRDFHVNIYSSTAVISSFGATQSSILGLIVKEEPSRVGFEEANWRDTSVIYFVTV